jgi:soluble lytic murein transglycosylase-like protein
MIRTTIRRDFVFAVFAILALSLSLPVHPAKAEGPLDAMISRHAAANNVPEALVRRVIKRESGGNPRAVNAGNYGLMQIRLGTARAMGYRGDANGLLDADTNMTYAVKYLAGAYRAAGGNHDRAVMNYARGYYYEAKRQGFNAYATAGAPR